MQTDRDVVVVGGGFAGLVAARVLARAGRSVVVCEAAPRVGGQVRSDGLADGWFDVGTESLHLSVPAVGDLLHDLGLRDDVRPARRGVTLVATTDRLRPLPGGAGATGPTRLRTLASSGVLSPGGLLRAACEPLTPRTRLDEDLSVGTFVAARFGRQVAERLVEPLVASLHAGDIDRLSLRSATPHLHALARQHRSLVMARRHAAPPAPTFVTLDGGLSRLTDRLADDPRFEVRCGWPAMQVARVDDHYVVTGPDEQRITASGVLFAVPAHVAASLLSGLDDDAAQPLLQLRTASVATVLLGYPVGALQVPFADATGLVVPREHGRALRSATFLGRKWPHLGYEQHDWVRLHLGRADDGLVEQAEDRELATVANDDLRDLLGTPDLRPAARHVVRWPATMPQLETGHTERVAEARRHLARSHPRVGLAGAAIDGIGLTGLLHSATRAARHLHAALDDPTGRSRPPTPDAGQDSETLDREPTGAPG